MNYVVDPVIIESFIAAAAKDAGGVDPREFFAKKCGISLSLLEKLLAQKLKHRATDATIGKIREYTGRDASYFSKESPQSESPSIPTAPTGSPPPSNTQEPRLPAGLINDTVYSRWNEALLTDKIVNAQPGDECCFFITRYSQGEFAHICEAILQRNRTLAALPQDGERLIIKVLMPGHDSLAAKIMQPEFQVNDHPSNEIINLANWFLDIKTEVRKKITIQIRFYDHRPWGNYFKVGNIHFFSPHFIKIAASSAPMIVCEDVTSPLGRHLAISWEASHKASYPVNIKEIRRLLKRMRRPA